MEEASFILLTTASEERLDSICAALKKEGVPYKLNDIPGSDSPARGSIVNLNKQVMVPEAHLLKARDVANLEGQKGLNKEYIGLNQMIRILFILIVILLSAYYVVRYL